MNKDIEKYNRLLLQLGDIEARINFWKRYKLDPLSQAEVIHLKEVRKKLLQEFDITKRQLRI